MPEGVFPRAGRYLRSRPTVWLAGIAVNAVILLLDREGDLAYLAAAATGATAILVAWALELLVARERAGADTPPHPALRRLAAVAFAVGVAWALTSIAVWLVPAVETLMDRLVETAPGVY
ncbi:MAG TPA: hypothetical protein VIH11_06585 [Gemmatimonadaceae bacterium]|nr:MAG: hypothetical protein A2050_09645 [Candidatus Rokubacteria bacterium GWA2_73_35]OGK91484.1 MAG: hypothetical protein A2W08_03755 [Candidatus Rokubacteria bacterium RBG_16_73_20]HBH00724.1 hypothetical protein [Candidatus Rokubacteria bacterium]